MCINDNEKVAERCRSSRKFMDGDFWISANQVGVDSSSIESKRSGKRFDAAPGTKSSSITRGGSYITDTNYYLVKKKGKSPKNIEDFGEDLLRKLKDYTHQLDTWD